MMSVYVWVHVRMSFKNLLYFLTIDVLFNKFVVIVVVVATVHFLLFMVKNIVHEFDGSLKSVVFWFVKLRFNDV